jgi:hypothetical protein
MQLQSLERLAERNSQDRTGQLHVVQNESVSLCLFSVYMLITYENSQRLTHRQAVQLSDITVVTKHTDEVTSGLSLCRCHFPITQRKKKDLSRNDLYRQVYHKYFVLNAISFLKVRRKREEGFYFRLQ